MIVSIDMNKKEIIENLYNDPKFDIILKALCKDVRYRDDLKQEVFIILLNKSEEKILKMYNDDYLMKWCSLVIKNQYQSNSSPFAIKIKGCQFKLDELIPDHTQDVREDNIRTEDIIYEDNIITIIDDILDNEIHWYAAHLFRLYYLPSYDRDGDVRKPLSTRGIERLHILRKTGIDEPDLVKIKKMKIDHVSIFHSIKSTLLTIKKKLRERYGDTYNID